jgi:hypothetical protein
VEQLPEVESVALEGAPGLSFVRRDGDDLLLFGWHPDGRGIVRIARMPGGYADMASDADPMVSVSPDGQFVVLQLPDEERGNARILSRDGVVWDRPTPNSLDIPVWADDASKVVVPLGASEWVVVELQGAKPRVHRIELKDVAPPGPPPGLDALSRPLAFSADGRWVYGETAANLDPRNRTLFRASANGGRTARIRALPTRGPDRAIAEAYDPVTGRTVDPTGFPTGDPSRLIVREPDGSKAWEAGFGAIVNTAWVGDGRLVVMHSDRIEPPHYLSVAVLSSDGGDMRSLVDAGPLSGGGIFGARHGYIVAAFFEESPDRQILLMMIDADDGRAGTLTLPGDDLGELRFSGWLN